MKLLQIYREGGLRQLWEEKTQATLWGDDPLSDTGEKECVLPDSALSLWNEEVAV